MPPKKAPGKKKQVRLFVVKGCGTCPNLQRQRTLTADSWEYAEDWLCAAKNNEKISGYIEHSHEEPKPGEFPDWCPLKAG